jgi:hypothetical protein
VPSSQKTKRGFATGREALEQELADVQARLAPYDELVAERDRLTNAIAALDGRASVESSTGTSTKKRVRWEQVAEYVDAHPGSMPAEIAAALEVPSQNVQMHLSRNEGTVFEKRRDGWHTLDGWEAHRRDI